MPPAPLELQKAKLELRILRLQRARREGFLRSLKFLDRTIDVGMPNPAVISGEARAIAQTIEEEMGNDL